MTSIIKSQWLFVSTSFAGLRRAVRRILATDHMAVDSLPEALRQDIGLEEGRPSMNRSKAFWSANRRLVDTIRTGPL
ncbi:hypothetical protein PDO_1786 [Rhizobium sp. PDO1-076]|uniref:hypothetical protein n=1 Tax=Rhizobium sp. PDO1-076 TaxID=1125979 RepID=UPI00024E2CF7|nr:hypothetical protein [Rhizobium sp. PDO1-076]EHS51762.1 hypothetical protein PDO_1786 [Rhizobium sp. PDO1-076]